MAGTYALSSAARHHANPSIAQRPKNRGKHPTPSLARLSSDEYPCKSNQDTSSGPAAPKPKKKTMAELDEELRLKLEEMSGDGGASGLELEDGKPVAMKRGVKNNMFRLI